MRVLQINAVEEILSTGRTVTEFDAFLTAHGVDSYIACSTTVADTGSYAIGTAFEKKAHALLSRLTGKQAWFSKGGTENLLKYIDKIKPDAVILRVLHGNFVCFPLLMKYLAKKNIVTVLFLHDCWYYTGKCCYYSQSDCDKWKSGCGNCPRLRFDNVSWFFDRTAQLWKAKKNLYENIPRLGVVGVSKWIADEARQSPLFASAVAVEGIYNGIDFDKFHAMPQAAQELRETHHLENKRILLGVSSQWDMRKGLADLEELAKFVSENEQIVCIGMLPNGLKLPKNVLHIPRTDNVQALAAWYSAADVFLNLSKEETFGKVSAEALSCGTPVVCYNTTANPEIVGEGCGAVCKDLDVRAYWQAVQTVLANGKAHYADACQSFAHERFDKTANYAKVLAFIEKLMQ